MCFAPKIEVNQQTLIVPLQKLKQNRTLTHTERASPLAIKLSSKKYRKIEKKTIRKKLNVVMRLYTNKKKKHELKLNSILALSSTFLEDWILIVKEEKEMKAPNSYETEKRAQSLNWFSCNLKLLLKKTTIMASRGLWNLVIPNTYTHTDVLLCIYLYISTQVRV